jgi:SanA protein
MPFLAARARLLRGAAVIGLLAVSGVAGANAWVSSSTRGHAYASVESVPARSVAIVPGAAVDVARQRPLASLTGRLETALALYRDHRVKAILVSGLDSASAPEVSVMRAWLLAHGVPATEIWTDPTGMRTRETMLNAAERFNVSDAVVCTQALYVERALYLASQAGINAVGVGLASSVSQSVRGRGAEALKTALAFAESYLREGAHPARLAASSPGTTVAVR